MIYLIFLYIGKLGYELIKYRIRIKGITRIARIIGMGSKVLY